MKRNILLSLLGILHIYTLFGLYRTPTIADSLVTLVIGSLVGFFIFLISKEVPPIKKTKEIEEILEQIDKLRLQREVTNLQLDIARLASTKKVVDEPTKKFVF